MSNGIGQLPSFVLHSANLNEINSNENYSVVPVTSKVPNPQPHMLSPAGLSRLQQIHVTDNNLEAWVNNAESVQERDWRTNLVNELKQNPIMIKDDGMHVQGHVTLSSLSQIKDLPDHLVFDGDLNIMRMPHLEKLPDNLVVKGNLELHECSQLKSLGQYLDVQGSLVINQCHQLTHLPGLLNLGQDLHLIDNLRLRELPAGLMVKGLLFISDCQQLTGLPEGLRVNGDVRIELCQQLMHVPDYMNLQGSLGFKYCIMLQALPENLIVHGNLELDHCLSLSALPEGLDVKGNLEAKSCLMLETVPQNLSVGGHFTLIQAAIEELPEEPFDVGGHIDLGGCSSLKSVPEWFHGLGPVNSDSGDNPRRINLIGTGLSQEAVNDLNHLHLMNIRYLVESDGQRVRTSKAIVTTYGQEAQDILKVLRDKPGQSLFIRYQNDVGIDQGGVSRQAFAQAYKQLLTDENGLFRAGNQGFFELKPQAFKQQKQYLRDLGLILSRTGILKMGLGYSMQPDILKKTHAAWLSVNSLGLIDEEKIDHMKSDDLFELLAVIDHEIQTNSHNADYLKEMNPEELRGFVKEMALPYFTLAHAMNDGGMNIDADADSFIKTVCGPDKLNRFFQEHLKVRILPDVDDQDRELVAQLKQDLREILASATSEDLKPLCEAMTGSAYLSPHAPDIIFNITGNMEKPDALLYAHSCARAMDIYTSAYKVLPEHQRFDLLKSFMFSEDRKFDAA